MAGAAEGAGGVAVSHLADVSSTRDAELIEIGKLAVSAEYYWERYHRDDGHVDEEEERRCVREHERAHLALESATRDFIKKWGAP